MVKKENCVIWIQILYTDFCLYTFYVYMKTDDIYDTLQKMLKQFMS